MRRKVKKHPAPEPDYLYSSAKLAKFTNYIMESGKKNTARTIVYKAMTSIKEKAKTENPLEVFDTALKNTAPLMEVRSRRVGGANYQIPREVRPERRQALSMKWIIEAAAQPPCRRDYCRFEKRRRSRKKTRKHPQNGRSQQSFCPFCMVIER